jgi:hypothetical protein
MTLYLIGGLGADERVFQYLTIQQHPTKIINWIKPIQKESLTDYTYRLSEQIDTTYPFGLLGVSFGGIIAVELSKILKPQITILISSVELSSQLPMYFIKSARTGIVNLLPKTMIKPPSFIMHFIFGAVNKKLLTKIINDTDPDFIKWAIDKIAHWQNETLLPKAIRIHGTNDKLIPLAGKAIEIKDGTHFMIVDRAEEISAIVNDHMNQI